MSVSGKRIIGMPTLLLYEAEGCTALIQTRDGSIYRGIIMEVQDNWNLNMKNVTMKTKYSNEIIPFEMLFIRGAQISFIVLPEMFKHSPMFQRVIDFKNGKTAPKVQTDPAIRNAARRCTFQIVCLFVEEVELFIVLLLLVCFLKQLTNDTCPTCAPASFFANLSTPAPIPPSAPSRSPLLRTATRTTCSPAGGSRTR